jgi:hypothetical protein
MHLQLALLCHEAQTTPEGKIDVRGVFHDLYAPGFPAKQGNMVLVLVVEWERSDEGRYDFRIDLTDSQGKQSLTINGHTDVDRRPPDRPPARTQLIMPLEDVVFPRPGRYRFRIIIKGRKMEGPSLFLVETPEAQESPPQ